MNSKQQAAALELIQSMRDALVDAIDLHIYSADDCIPDDCHYHQLIKEADKLLDQ